MNMETTFEERWEKIEAYTNWDKIYQVMKALDWAWHFENNNYGIPNIDTLKRQAREMLFRAWETHSHQISTGGFQVGYENDELWLCFSIEDCHTVDL